MTSPIQLPHRTLRVLVVEDEPRLRDLLVDVIPDMGFVADAVRSAELAWPMIQSDPPDVVVLDLQLPVMGGLELLEKIRERNLDIAAVILSGFGDFRSAQRAIDLGVTAFISKPFDLGELDAALAKIVRERRQSPVSPAADVQKPSPDFGLTSDNFGKTLAESQFELIRRALSRNRGNRTATAAELGISRRTLHHKIAQYRSEGLSLD